MKGAVGVITMCLVASTSAFVAPLRSLPSTRTSQRRPSSALSMMVDDEPKTAIVQVTTENVEFSAGVVGGIAGAVVGGPVLGAICSVLANYGAKQSNEVGEAVRGVSKTAIEVFNFVATLNTKYDLTGQASGLVNEAVGKLKESDDTQSIDKVEATIKEATEKAKQLAAEYDLVAKGKQALGVVGELADTAIVKGVELEKEYKVLDKVKASVAQAVDTAAAEVKKA